MNFSNKHVAKIFFVADPVEEFSQIIFNCNFETLNLDLDLKLPEFNLRRIIWGVEVQKKVYNFSDTTNQTFVYKWYTSEAFDGKKIKNTFFFSLFIKCWIQAFVQSFSCYLWLFLSVPTSFYYTFLIFLAPIITYCSLSS